MSLIHRVQHVFSEAVRTLYGLDEAIDVSIPDPQFGDFSCNIAMKLAGTLGKPPREIAEELKGSLSDEFSSVEIAGPGFINIRVTDNDLIEYLSEKPSQPFSGQSWVVEYSCPNYFKELHAGHLYQTLIGDALARMIERAGATVHRTNFGGDVGLHVAKALFGMNQLVNGTYNHDGYSNVLSHMHDLGEEERSAFLSQSYVQGSGLYEAEESAKEWITKLNRSIYAVAKAEYTPDDNVLAEIRDVYETGREWSRQYFISLYNDLRVDPFETYYPESATEGRGVAEVMKGLVNKVFVESQDAIVFEGEAHGLHTRVFITKEKLPTYETKDVGLILIEKEDFDFEKRVLLTGRDQQEYMKVVWKALDQLYPGTEAQMTHLTNGIINFGDGKKMSSRLGNVTRAVDVMQAVRGLVDKTEDKERDERIALGAIKYEFLKYRLGGDISFNPEESVSLQGNSGPYLQYAYVRAKSILAKATDRTRPENVEQGERSLLRELVKYAEVVETATREYQTSTLCTYLYELAGVFNKFYEQNRVIDDPRQAERLWLVEHYADILLDGLTLLGIEVPDKM